MEGASQPIARFLALRKSESAVLIDARSEREFAQGHWPGSINLPILNDAERIEVGTCYKQEGSEAAVLLGLQLVGPRFHSIALEAKAKFGGKLVLLYCWRGGLRSQILGWLLRLVGFEVEILPGGYKTFRHWVLATLTEPHPILLVAGPTGSGKTEILALLQEAGEQVIDLEGIARHKGSAFGGLGMPEQPTQEQFENELALQWASLDPDRAVWLEDESLLIGRRALPKAIFEGIRHANGVWIELPMEQRRQNLLAQFGGFSTVELTTATLSLRKRLGGLRLQQAVEALVNNRLEDWLDILIPYYDDAYARMQRGRGYFCPAQPPEAEHVSEWVRAIRFQLGEMTRMANEQLPDFR